ncbi:hypothetical protein FB451DRAFT_1033822 [Mycena latifolia]|nr:hypothetical protein FB451DRAFT_1033822 [Mycena latifolia]
MVILSSCCGDTGFKQSPNPCSLPTALSQHNVPCSDNDRGACGDRYRDPSCLAEVNSIRFLDFRRLINLRSHFLPNASGFQIVGGQFVLGNVNNHPPTETTTLPSLPIEILSESEIYCQRLLYQKRGFPLYMPDPQRNLPAEYRTSGVRIGHVGRVTPEGAFDPFFNIYYSAEHPINSRGVPENFVPLPMYREEDVFPVDRKPGDYVSTPSVQESDLLSSARYAFR